MRKGALLDLSVQKTIMLVGIVVLAGVVASFIFYGTAKAEQIGGKYFGANIPDVQISEVCTHRFGGSRFLGDDIAITPTVTNNDDSSKTVFVRLEDGFAQFLPEAGWKTLEGGEEWRPSYDTRGVGLDSNAEVWNVGYRVEVWRVRPGKERPEQPPADPSAREELQLLDSVEVPAESVPDELPEDHDERDCFPESQ